MNKVIAVLMSASLMLVLAEHNASTAITYNDNIVLSPPVFYGIYGGYNTIVVQTEYNNTTIDQTKLLALLEPDETYMILVYKVPRDWIGRASLFSGPPDVDFNLRGEFEWT